MDKFLNNEISIVRFANNLSQEWAALPLVSGPNAGKSYHAGTGNNKSADNYVKIVLDTLKALNPKWEEYKK